LQRLPGVNASIIKAAEAAVPVTTIIVVKIRSTTAADTDPITNRPFQKRPAIPRRRRTADIESPNSSFSRWRQLHGGRCGARNSEKKAQKKRGTTEEEEEEAREKEKKAKRRKQEFAGKEKGADVVVVVGGGGGESGGGSGGGGGGGGGGNGKRREGGEEDREGDGEAKGSGEGWSVANKVGSIS